MARALHLPPCIEGIDDVARQFTRRDDDNVETDFAVCVSGIASEPHFGRANDAVLCSLGHRFHGVVGAGARLDLDENQDPTPPRNDVDFAEWRFPAPGENAIGFGDQQQRSAAFRRKPALERFDALRRGIAFGAFSGSARRAMVGIFFGIFTQRQRASVEFAPRAPGNMGDFTHGVF
jgi:hypothetical protein